MSDNLTFDELPAYWRERFRKQSKNNRALMRARLERNVFRDRLLEHGLSIELDTPWEDK